MKKSLLLIISFTLLFGSGCRAASNTGNIRLPAVAGQFYPDNPNVLRLAVSRYLDEAVPVREEKPFALIVPHAGIVYSGQIAADAIKQASNRHYDVVIILGTNHTSAGFTGVSVYSKGAFRTPLGDMPIEENVVARILSASSDFKFDPRVHEREHSIEVELPFLQVILPHVKIVPIVVSEPDLKLCRKLGDAIAQVAKERDVLVIASSDLSHYPKYEGSCRVDRETLKAIALMNPAKIKTTLEQQMDGRIPQLETCACGEAPILSAIFAAKAVGANCSIVLSCANSGDASVGDYNRVVGYGSVMFAIGEGIDTTALHNHYSAVTNISKSDELSENDKRALLAHARKSILWYASSLTLPLNRGFSTAAMIPEGAFVTLKKKGELRGCIGHMAEDFPLCRTVGGMALAAAFEDQRFSPVEKEEIDKLEIEISALTPMKPIPNADAIVVGRDGVVIRKNGRSAVFLPQVATEQGWNRDELLEHLCDKAGLPRGSWKSGAGLFTFQAIVFSESSLKK